MNEDCKVVEDEFRMLNSVWKQHCLRLSQGIESEDVETVVNSFLHIYEIFYAVKYTLWNAQMLPKNYKLPKEDLALLIAEIIPGLEKLKIELEKAWFKGTLKIEKVLDKKSERELYIHLNQNFGSGKYAVNLD
jgi:hypothetical protein